MKFFLRLLDLFRIIFTGFAFFLGYYLGFNGEGYNAAVQLHYMIPMIIVAIAGTSAIEGLFFGDDAAEIKGYEKGSRYQKQSALALLSMTLVSLYVYFSGWGIKAELTIFFTFIIFFIMSAVNHLISALRDKNYKWQNINRPLLVLLLIAGMIYPLINVF